MRFPTSPRGPLLGLVVLACLGLVLMAASPVAAQVTDTNGYITSSNWLALGPFPSDFGCGTQAEILCNHIAPTYLHCEYPEEGDEIEYNAALACTNSYTGPLGGTSKPVWRLFDDTTNDCLNNLGADVAGGGAVGNDDALNNVVTFLVTYVEYDGDDPVEVEFCANSDDGIQIWLDSAMVRSNNACRGYGDCAGGACDERFPVTLTPGMHRILVGTWEAGGGFGCSFRLLYQGQPVVDGVTPDFYFDGTENPGMDADCPKIPFRTAVVGTGGANDCPPGAEGPINVTIGAIGEVSGPAGTVTITETILGSASAAEITASNGGVVTALGADPVVPVGQFADHVHIITNPVCPAGNGDTVEGPAGTYTVTSVGEDIWTNGDTFQFAYNVVRGNFDVTVHIVERTESDQRWGKHGIQARQDLTSRSRYSWTHDAVGPVTEDPLFPGTWLGVDNNDDSTRHASRPTYGGADNFEATTLPGHTDGVDDYCDGIGPDDGSCLVEHHDYLRLVRVGSVFESYSRADSGAPWVFLGSHDWGTSAPQDVLVGLAASSHSLNCDAPIEIIFDEVDFGGATIVPITNRPATGTRISWDVPRSTLEGAGVGYSIDTPPGSVTLSGDVDGTVTSPPTTGVTLTAPGGDLGPLDQFDHGHWIGNVAQCAGTTITDADGLVTITGAGADIWGTADQFMFAYSEQTGDFTAEVLIFQRQMGNNEWAKHGIMARENCSPGSRYVYCADQQALDPAISLNGTAFQWRPTQDADANWSGASPLGAVHADRLRLQRIGSVFTGYALDPANNQWIATGPSQDWGPDAPDTIQLGLAVTSHDGCNLVTVTFDEWEISGAPPQPPTNVTCAGAPDGGVDLTWEVNGEEFSDHVITVNGVEVATAGPLQRGIRVAKEAIPSEPGAFAICVTNDEGQACCGFTTLDETAVNCGGAARSDLGDGRNWLADNAASPSPFLMTPGTNVADFAAGLVAPAQWAPVNLELVEPEFSDDLTRSALFATERWLDGDLVWKFGVPAGSYSVTLLFAENCCSGGCEDLPDPQLSTAGDCRVVDVEINGSLVLDQFAQHVEIHRELGNPLPTGTPAAGEEVGVWGIGLAKGPYAVNATGGVVEIIVKDLGPGGVPQNASIKGILVSKGGGPVGPVFHRGDANGDGQMNITDGIFVLNYLFLGGPTPDCLEAANGNDDADINITDGIFILNYLFLGGATPPAPGPTDEPCGPDPASSPSNLGCVSYPNC